VEQGADPSCSFVRIDDPGAHLPGRIVAHVLLVAARQFGHPRSFVILVESRDRAFHDY
jgi:hypothetical protein